MTKTLWACRTLSARALGLGLLLCSLTPLGGLAAPAVASKPLVHKAQGPGQNRGRPGLALPPAPMVTLEPRVPRDPADPRELRIRRLREQIVDLLRSPSLARLRVGLHVQDADSGEVLVAHNAAAAFNPASNTKILTTAAALKLLGTDWPYRTVLLAAAPAPQSPPVVATASLGGVPEAEPAGVVHGDLFLQGSGDPALTISGLAQIARDLNRAGVTRIEGDLLLDDHFRSLEELTHAQHAQEAGTGALLLNRNAYSVRLTPGAAGHPAMATIEPRSSFFVLESRVKTVRGKRAKVLVDHYRRDGRLVVTVTGRLGAAHPELLVRRQLPDGAAFAAAVLRQTLADFGIELSGQVRLGPPPAGPLRILAEHRTPLTQVCRLSNKDSNNFVADTIFKTLGGERFGLPGTLAKGTRAVSEWLSMLGVDPARMKIINGSGLTHENRLRPDDLGYLLRSLYRDLQLAPEFLQSLAIGGIDGTIRYRFHGPTVGLVRAKTGTLAGVSALSGYVGEKDKVLVFAIMVEGFGPRRVEEVRHAQVLIVESLLRFLRDSSPLPAPVVLPPAPALPDEDGERDAEDDGDPA